MESWILNFLIALPAILWAITVHEFAHGLVAYKLGDPTPKLQGRLTLNPVAHLDILGFIALLIAHFGWAKPVAINPRNFKRINPRWGEVLVAVAGPAANFISALLSALLLKYFPFSLLPVGISEPLFLILKYNLFINVAFGVFNLLPIPPLDGSKILEAFLPYKLYLKYKEIEPYGPIILLILVISPVLNWLLTPIVNAMVKTILFLT
ncbi:site-2 protease family protein [Thermovibrio sp.]